MTPTVIKALAEMSAVATRRAIMMIWSGIDPVPDWKLWAWAEDAADDLEDQLDAGERKLFVDTWLETYRSPEQPHIYV